MGLVFFSTSLQVAAQEKAELKWTLVTGDRYSYEVSNEITETDAPGKPKKRVTKRSYKLSAILEVVDAKAYPVQVELLVVKTSQRTEVNQKEVAAETRSTAGGDWDRPVSGTYMKNGELKLNAGDFKQAAEGVDLANYVFMNFPLLPEKVVRVDEQWPGNRTEAKETLRLASLAEKEKYFEATVDGTSKNQSDIMTEGGIRLGSRTTTVKTHAVLDVTNGWFKSVELTANGEQFDAGVPKAVKTSSSRMAITLGRLEARKK